jgi:hypothetical protein
MSPQRATTLGWRWLLATIAFWALGAIADNLWTHGNEAIHTAVYVPAFYCVTRFIHWRGWVAGWKHRHEEWVERTPRPREDR